MAFLLSLWEGCRGEGSSCRPRCEATAAILDEAAEEVVPVSHEPLFRHPSPKGGEKRCPVSGQLASAGTCPMAKPKAKAAPAKGLEQLPTPATTEVKGVKEAESSAAPRSGAASSVPESKKADTAEKSAAAKASGSQKGQQPQKQPRQSSSASGQQRSQSSSRKSSKSKKPPPPVYSDEDSSDSDFGCPASKQEAAFEKELKALKKKVRSGLTQEEKDELDNPWLTTEVSDGERKLKKEMFISFYREQYKRLKKGASPDIKQYEGPAGGSNGFTAQGGHQPMPRPKDVVVPPDFRKPVGRLSSQELARFGCDNPRKLISIHGDIFDISDRPDKYGPEGPYYYMAGHDITWGLVVGEDSEETMDRFYDIYKVKPKDLMDRKLQGLMSWWAFYEKEYGAPVGRLTSFDKEWGLPPPPHMTGGECSVM